MPRAEPIRVGDRFRGKGCVQIWVVIGTRPGGIVEMKAEDKAAFGERYHREVREMDRLEGRNEEIIERMALGR